MPMTLPGGIGVERHPQRAVRVLDDRRRNEHVEITSSRTCGGSGIVHDVDLGLDVVVGAELCLERLSEGLALGRRVGQEGERDRLALGGEFVEQLLRGLRIGPAEFDVAEIRRVLLEQGLRDLSFPVVDGGVDRVEVDGEGDRAAGTLVVERCAGEVHADELSTAGRDHFVGVAGGFDVLQARPVGFGREVRGTCRDRVDPLVGVADGADGQAVEVGLRRVPITGVLRKFDRVLPGPAGERERPCADGILVECGLPPLPPQRVR